LVLMMFAGAAIRQFFVMRHGFKLGRNAHPWPYAAAGLVVIALLVGWLRPAEPNATNATLSVASSPALMRAGGQFSYENLQPLLAQRCYACHGAEVQQKNVRLDSPENVAKHAQAVYQQVVVSRAMPLNNATGISELERNFIKQWFEAGNAVAKPVN
jgi:uncharacterized membrane protein